MYFSEYAVYAKADPKYEDLCAVFFAHPGEMGEHGWLYLASKGENGVEWRKLDLDKEDDCTSIHQIFPSDEVFRYLLDPANRTVPEGWKPVHVFGSCVFLVHSSIYPLFCRYLKRKYNTVTSRGKNFDLSKYWPFAVGYAVHNHYVEKEREHQERKNN